MNTRSSAEEIGDAPIELTSGKRSGLSDLEKVGLVALGALVVGAVLNDGRDVVSNSGDRVVVRNREGSYQVYKDDDILLRRPGADLRTEIYADGSTRTIIRRKTQAKCSSLRVIQMPLARRSRTSRCQTAALNLSRWR